MVTETRSDAFETRLGQLREVLARRGIAAAFLETRRNFAWLTAGVGVYRSAESIITTTSLAASTSHADAHAGSDRACVSRPMNSGPSTPCAARYSAMA